MNVRYTDVVFVGSKKNREVIREKKWRMEKTKVRKEVNVELLIVE